MARSKVKIPDAIRQYFEFSPLELRSILALFVVMTAITVIRLLPIFTSEIPSKVQFDTWIFEDSLLPVSVDEKKKSERGEHRVWNLSEFNPNQIRAVNYREMGFSDRFIQQFFEYRRKHSFVKTRNEFFAIYAFTSEERKLIEPNIILFQSKEYSPTTQRIEDQIQIDVNSADSFEWSRLKGIGPKLSSRIIRHRDALGGFHSKSQLLEIYGIDSALAASMLPHLQNFGVIRPIGINSISESDLAKHPYCRQSMAKRICAYRKQHGSFHNVNELMNLYGVDSTWFNRISPYLVSDQGL